MHIQSCIISSDYYKNYNELNPEKQKNKNFTILFTMF